MSKDSEGANEGAENQEPVEGNDEGKIVLDGEEFDAERALRTIEKQREAEAALKAKLRKYEDAEAEEEEAKKSLETRVAERDIEILELRKQLAVRDASQNFRAQAVEAGIADPDLALLVAKESGLIGDFDPKTGTIELGKVDFDKLVEKHPILQGEKKEGGPAGDAGRRSSGKTLTPGEIFSRSVRGIEV